MTGRWFPPIRHVSLTNTITAVTVVAAFASLLFASQGAYRWSLTLLAFALTCDHMDGVLARRLGTASEFGAAFDSLGDALAFCVVPAFIGYEAGLHTPWAVALVITFPLVGLWRLADFSITGVSSVDGTRVYSGVPTSVIAAWFVSLAPLWLHRPPTLLLVFYPLADLLMLSGLRYPKEGLVNRVLYILLPLGTLALWLA